MSAGIVYAVVAASGGVILAEHSARSDGNFKSIAQQMIQRLPYNIDGKKTYTYQGYNFYSLVSAGLAYVCVANENFGVRIPFGFLDDIRMLFVNKYGTKGLNAVEYAMNDEFSRILAQKMDFYSNDTSADRIRAINAQIELVKSQMLENLEKVIERGDHIEELVVKTEGLKTTTSTFKAKATQMKTTLWWKNVKLYIIIGIILLVILYIGLGSFCGFPIFHKCIRMAAGNSTSPSKPPHPHPNPPQPPPTPAPRPPPSNPTPTQFASSSTSIPSPAASPPRPDTIPPSIPTSSQTEPNLKSALP